MSRYSGKFDLCDFISGTGGWFDKDGKPVKIGDPNVHCYYSDELLDFEAFKEKTKGVIHQHHKVEVSELNQDFVKEHCRGFSFEKHVTQVPDKRRKSGVKELVSYTYTYYGTVYKNLKELNKHQVYIETDIHFDTLLDIIPYYPYLVTVACGDYVVISKESFVDTEFKSHLKYGWISDLDYKKDLQEHYLEVCKEYFLKDVDKRTHVVSIKDKLSYEPIDFAELSVPGYYVYVDKPVDYMHTVRFVWKDGLNHAHWTSPKFVKDNIIELSKEDVESLLKEAIDNDAVKIEYVEKLNYELRLA